MDNKNRRYRKSDLLQWAFNVRARYYELIDADGELVCDVSLFLCWQYGKEKMLLKASEDFYKNQVQEKEISADYISKFHEWATEQVAKHGPGLAWIHTRNEGDL